MTNRGWKNWNWSVIGAIVGLIIGIILALSNLYAFQQFLNTTPQETTLLQSDGSSLSVEMQFAPVSFGIAKNQIESGQQGKAYLGLAFGWIGETAMWGIIGLIIGILLNFIIKRVVP